MSNDYLELKERLRKLRTQLEAIPKVSEPPKSTFKILGTTRSEHNWNTFLAYFLDPSQPHGFGAELLKSFLDEANQEGNLGINYYHRDFENVEVVTEDSSPEGNRPDIVIRAPEEWFVLVSRKKESTQRAGITISSCRRNMALTPVQTGSQTCTGGKLVQAFNERLGRSHGRYPTRSVSQLEDFLSTVTQVINMEEDDFTETQKERIRLLAEYKEDIDSLFESTNQLRQRAVEEWPERFRSHIDEDVWTDEWHALPSKWGQMFRDGWFLDGELNPTTDVEETKGNVGVRLFFMHYIRHEDSFLDGIVRFELGCSTRVPVRDEFHRLYNSNRWQGVINPILDDRNIVNRGNKAEYTRKIYDVDQSGLPESYFETLVTAFEEHLPVAEIVDEMLAEAVRNVKES